MNAANDDSGRNFSPAHRAWKLFISDIPARIGVAGVFILLLPALYAPFIANGLPLAMKQNGKWSLPFIRDFFAPSAPEVMVEKFFNYAALLLLFLLPVMLLARLRRKAKIIVPLLMLIVLLPFCIFDSKMDKRNYRSLDRSGEMKTIFAPIPYSPAEISGTPFAPPDKLHPLGCDSVGRDVAARLIYGSRVSLAVGIFATLIALSIGTAAGLVTGYFRGWFDLCMMRLVEIMLCFPTFLLLLILMSMLSDRKSDQAIPLVIAVIGFTGWLGVTFLVRGEVLKQSAMPYIKSCVVAGLPVPRVLFRHLLPNILPPILISFTFGIAGAILSESGLSFLGFGVQPPTASWGEMLRQAFDNPLDHWHLTFFPGMALFIAVMSFNFMGEGLRRALSVR